MKECVPEFKQYSIAQIANDCIEGEPQVSKVAVDQDQLDKDEHENSITKYRVSEEQVVGDYHELETNYDLLTVLMLKLGPADGAENHPILKLLDVLLSPDTKPDEKKTILERDFDIPMTKSMREEADAMCNLGQGIRERAVIESTGNTIIKIMINKNLSFDDAYDSIYCEEDRDDLKAYVDEHMAVAK